MEAIIIVVVVVSRRRGSTLKLNIIMKTEIAAAVAFTSGNDIS